jgi:hypothetical protein
VIEEVPLSKPDSSSVLVRKQTSVKPQSASSMQRAETVLIAEDLLPMHTQENTHGSPIDSSSRKVLFSRNKDRTVSKKVSRKQLKLLPMAAGSL